MHCPSNPHIQFNLTLLPDYQPRNTHHSPNTIPGRYSYKWSPLPPSPSKSGPPPWHVSAPWCAQNRRSQCPPRQTSHGNGRTLGRSRRGSRSPSPLRPSSGSWSRARQCLSWAARSGAGSWGVATWSGRLLAGLSRGGQRGARHSRRRLASLCRSWTVSRLSALL